MTNTDLLAKIKAEIDKRYAEYREKMKTDDFTYYEGMADALDLFEQFIDSLESEKPMNQDEVVINGHKVSYDKDKDAITMAEIPNDLEEAADSAYRIECEAAEKRYEEEYSTGEYCHEQSFKWGFQEGVDWHKDHMLKEAVEGEVIKDWDNNLSVKSATISGFKFGDKVRVIVLKKEDLI